MTKVSDVRDQLNTIMATVLPAYEKLSDNYEASDNPNPIFEKGYMIGFSAGENLTNEWCNLGEIRIRRNFQIVLVNMYVPNLDADQREGTENRLLDDQFTFVAAVERDVTLTGVAISSRYSFDNGLEYLIDDRKQFIIVNMTITVDYHEETA